MKAFRNLFKRAVRRVEQRKPLIQRIGPALGLLLFAASLWVLHRQVKSLSLSDILRSLREISPAALLAAGVLMVTDYFVLTGFDFLALRSIGVKLTHRRVAPAAFAAYAFSHNIGLSVLSGGAVRLRWYTAMGVKPSDVGRVVVFCGVTFLLGLCLVGGTAIIQTSIPNDFKSRIAPALFRAGGAAMLALGAGYLALSACRRKPFSLRRAHIQLPPFRIAAIQAVLGSLDWILATAVLYVLLPSSVAVSFPAFLGLYCLAYAVGNFSMVPGGLGVFEATLLFIAPGHNEAAGFLAGLIVFRAVYFLLPLAIASMLLAGNEATVWRKNAAPQSPGAAPGPLGRKTPVWRRNA